jgi:hypothetical protein
VRPGRTGVPAARGPGREPESPGAGALEPAPLRLTRRGRIVVRGAVALCLLLAVIGGVLLLGRPAQAGSVSRPLPVSYRVILPGETLWQIAGEVAPNTDRRDTVAQILELNALSTAQVQVGQRIALPAPAK